jgi:hypothetical protein
MECNSLQPLKSVYFPAVVCTIAKTVFTEQVDIVIERAPGALSNDFTQIRT